VKSSLGEESMLGRIMEVTTDWSKQMLSLKHHVAIHNTNVSTHFSSRWSKKTIVYLIPFWFLINTNNFGMDRHMSTKHGMIIMDLIAKPCAWPVCTQDVESHFGSPSFPEIGSPNILATDWGISSKLGLQIHFDLLKRVLSLLP